MSKDSTRKYKLKSAPIIRHAVDSIASRYGINNRTLRNRLNAEGFTDYQIQQNNRQYESPNRSRNSSNYYSLNKKAYPNDGFGLFGLDDVGDFIMEGKVKPINERWWSSQNDNEKGRKVNTATGVTPVESIGLTAATLKYFRDKAIKDFPNQSQSFYDKAAEVYYNRGASGGKNYMKNKSK